MPANSHLSWFDIKQFGGLWTAGANSQMPADRAQVMSGCHPQKNGGLRAFLGPVSTLPGTNIDIGIGNNIPVAFAAHPRAGANTLFWLATAGGTNRLYESDANASTPDDPSLDITGDIDLRARFCPSDYTPATDYIIISNLDTTNFRGYELALLTTGSLRLRWGDGSAERSASSTAALTDSSGEGVMMARVTLDVNNGAGGRDIAFYSTAIGNTWNALGLVVTQAGVTSIAASTNPLKVSGPNTSVSSTPNDGLFWAEVRNGIDGSLVANPDFSALRVDTPGPFTDGAGRTWTINSGRITHTGSFVRNLQLWRSAGGTWARYSTAPFAYAKSLDDGGNQPRFARKLLGGISQALVAVDAFDTNGVFLLNDYADGVTVEPTSSTSAGLVIHQERLVTGVEDEIKFSAPGTSDFVAAGSGSVRLNSHGYVSSGSDVYPGPLVAVLLAVPPGDLLAITRDGRVYNIQGDLADPTVRELGRMTAGTSHEGAVSSNGLYVIVPNHGVVRLALDGAVESLSDDISPVVWNTESPHLGLGQIAVTERYVFCPNNHATAEHSNGALVLDTETGAWFTSTHPEDYTIPTPRLMALASSAVNGGVWVVAGKAPNALGVSNPHAFAFRTGPKLVGYNTTADHNPEARASTWEWKSAPLREPAGRYLDIREVQIPVHAFTDDPSDGADTSTLSVTVNGTTITKNLPVGRSVQTFLFKERGRELDITVKAKSNDAKTEAPMIESVRVGWRPGPLL